jgi:hypothetical protein
MHCVVYYYLTKLEPKSPLVHEEIKKTNCVKG